MSASSGRLFRSARSRPARPVDRGDEDPLGPGLRGSLDPPAHDLVASGQPADERGHPLDVVARRTERIDERRGHHDAVGAGPGDRPHVGRPADAEPDGDGHGRDRPDVADQAPDGRWKRGPGAGHADERDAVQEPAAALGDHPAARRLRGRGDEIDDGQPGLAGHGLERGALVGRQVGHDQAGRAGGGEAPGHGRRRRRLRGPGWRSPSARAGGPDGPPRSARSGGANARAWRLPPARRRTPAGGSPRRPAGRSTAGRPRAGRRPRRPRPGRS